MRALSICAFTLLAALACATPYQPIGFRGGFTESRLGPDFFAVRFNGNGYTDAARATDFTILRAAELALKAGYPYFIVMQETDTTSQKATATTSYSRLFGWQTRQDVTIKPGQEIKVRCFHDKPSGAGYVYEAGFIQRELRSKYQLEPVTSEPALARAGEPSTTAETPRRAVHASRPTDAVPASMAPGRPQGSNLERALAQARSAVRGASVKIDYDAERRWLQVRFRSSPGAENAADRYRVWRDNQRNALAEFRKHGVPVKFVSCTTNMSDASTFLMMTTHALYVERYATPSAADEWLRVTQAQRWTSASSGWRPFQP